MDNYFNAKPIAEGAPYFEDLSPVTAPLPAAKAEPGRPVFPSSPASKTVAQLKADLKSLGLSTSGLKAELVQRLSSTAATSPTPPPPAAPPILLYLPGLDGTGLSASDQYPALTSSFSVRRLTIPSSDRTSFYGLQKLVLEYIRGLDEEVILVGER